jgi:hypothetical protein
MEKKSFDVDYNYACAKSILWTATKHLHLNLIFTIILRFLHIPSCVVRGDEMGRSFG